MRFKRIALVLGLSAAALSGQAAPIEVRDALGRSVVLPAAPQRLVTIFASNTELVTSLGLADRIVGVEEYTRFPPEVMDKPRVGGRLGFSVDAVVAQRPDLVIVTPARQAANQLVDPMTRIGVPVIVLLSRSVGEVLDNIRLIGRATGVPERGEALAQSLQARLDAVAQQVAQRTAPRMVMITGRVGNGMLLVARADTYTGEAMRMAGGRFAIAGRGAVAQVSPEAILASDPDVLLFAGTKAALDDLVQLPGWRDMRAVRDKRAVTVSRSEFLIPGPRTIDGIERLAKWLGSVEGRP
ncbi:MULTISPECIES: ABC transporter substrate-binding protein [unclassified Variovorax]|uniref:ABC transporter substrate-binding protein n=1 Tax=unclassified Variovorax TaxID=663243 RepID=UPI0025752376|nr:MULTISPECIES: ABC transporter substrate-binding protein [unclassified Variovorax]MDM0089025.1 ABC transporter substrate-binding protein [Variovorax sp. J22G40]MDM0147098.1 ABC transporter substrate-binding protein [Variovorax sp. J2P1-31]